MRLFIGNATKQKRIFYYRIPGETVMSVHSKIEIGPGQQEQIPGSHTRAVLDSLLDPYLPYGFVEASTLSQNRAFVGVCYSFDKPIPANLLDYTIDANDGKMDDRAREEFIKFASSSAAQFQNPEMSQEGVTLKQIDMCIDDLPRKGEDASPLLADGVSVTASRPQELGRKRAGRGR